LKRISKTYPLTGDAYKSIKFKMLNWANQFSISVFLDNNEYTNHRYHIYECLLAVNPVFYISAAEGATLDTLYQRHTLQPDWFFGHLNYDYKNQLFNKLPSAKQNKFSFPNLYFFCPQTVCYIGKEKDSLTIETLTPDADLIFSAILSAADESSVFLPSTAFTKRIQESAYLETIIRLQEHIRNGDCYEINFCNEGFAENATINPLHTFQKLQQLSPAPFAAYYKHHDQFLICSSPERYICKQQNKVISQPIKGTIKRGINRQEDQELIHALYDSQKDRAENVMIVDLVRNDLSRSCEVGTIHVEELFGIYSYPSVHQMISTVTGRIEENSPFTDALRYSFPMGSMTGAPKLKVMQLIEQYELAKRELFAGAIGYITPAADFDFNVIIRSLFYNQQTRYLSYQTGGAITYDSIPQQEWEETLLKAFNLEKLFKV
jgi:para-aminobenzoate synthetase component 1